MARLIRLGMAWVSSCRCRACGTGEREDVKPGRRRVQGSPGPVALQFPGDGNSWSNPGCQFLALHPWDQNSPSNGSGRPIAEHQSPVPTVFTPRARKEVATLVSVQATFALRPDPQN